MQEHISNNPEAMANAPKGIKIPHVWTIILFCLIAAGLMTWIVPAGMYDARSWTQPLSILLRGRMLVSSTGLSAS